MVAQPAAQLRHIHILGQVDHEQGFSCRRARSIVRAVPPLGCPSVRTSVPSAVRTFRAVRTAYLAERVSASG